MRIDREVGVTIRWLFCSIFYLFDNAVTGELE